MYFAGKYLTAKLYKQWLNGCRKYNLHHTINRSFGYNRLRNKCRTGIYQETVVLSLGDTFTQEDIDTGKIAFVNTQSSAFVDGFRVDIGNSANGWLPNQRIYVNQTGLDVDQFDIKNLAIWPNPTNDLLNIRLDADTSNNVKIKLFDLRGRVIFNRSYDQNNAIFEESIHIGNFASGIYLLNVEQGNKQTTKRVLISD